MRRAAIFVCAGFVAAASLAACGGGSSTVSDAVKKVAEDATGCKVNGSNNSASVNCKGKNGFSVGTDAKLPSGFPSAVPVPAGKIVSSFSTETDGKPMYTVTYKVDGSLESAANDYRSKLESNGYTIDDSSSLDLGGSGGLRAYKAVGTDWDVNVVGSGVGTQGDANGLLVTVSKHDPSNDTTTTSTG